jgi:hypothetical protein
MIAVAASIHRSLVETVKREATQDNTGDEIPREGVGDEEILKQLGRIKWAGPTELRTLGISEETVERLIAAGKLKRKTKYSTSVGIAN